MRKITFFVSLLCYALFLSSSLQGQEYATEYLNDGKNPNSLRPVNEADIMFRKRLTYRMDLRQKQNKPFFATSQQLTKLIIEATKAGVLRPYEDATLSTRMANDMFLENLEIDPTETPDFGEDIFGGTDPDFDPWETGTDEGGETEVEIVNEYFPNQLYVIEFEEDLIFDRKRSRMIHDIQSITIKIPATYNPAGYEKTLATYSYKEVVQNLFRGNPEANWYNVANNKAHLNFEKAFDLRLFAARIIAFDNSDNQIIIDMYGDQEVGAVAELNYQYSLQEYENNLWEN